MTGTGTSAQAAQAQEAVHLEAARTAATAATEESHCRRCAAERAVEDAEYAALPSVVRNLMTVHKLGRLETQLVRLSRF